MCTSKRNCNNPDTEPHLCPYRQEVADDNETLCTCCSECEHECELEI